MRTNNFTKTVLHYFGFNALARLFLKHKIYVLNYHSVSYLETDDEFNADLYKNLSIKKDKFEQHIKFLKDKDHTFVNFNDLLTLNLKNINKPTIIYFDDGFKDNLKNALPILKKYGAKATVFVSTDIASGNSMLWTIKHRAYLKSIGVKDENIINELKRMNKNEREERLSTEYGKSNFSWDNNMFLNWDEIKELSENGVEIGSHGVSHSNLLQIDDELLKTELKESKKIIEDKIGKSVTSFSYPYGRWNDRVNKTLESLGYKAIVSKGHGLNNISNVPIILKTVPVKIDDSVINLEAKLYSRYFLRS